MSEKLTKTEEMFRRLADTHEEAYNPADWEECRLRLRAAGLVRHASLGQRYRMVGVVMLVALLLPWQRLNYTPTSTNQYTLPKAAAHTHKAGSRPLAPISPEQAAPISAPAKANTSRAAKEVNAPVLPAEMASPSLASRKASPSPRVVSQEHHANPQDVEKTNLVNRSERVAAIAKSEMKMPDINDNTLRLEMLVMPISPNTAGRGTQLRLMPNTPKEARNTLAVPKRSFNALWGTNKGLKGIELGAIGNITRENAKGWQTAGIFNAVGEEMHGVQIAGLMNMTGNELHGVQLAGLGNIANYRSEKLNPEGDIIKRSSRFNAQIAAFFNMDFRDVQHLQVSSTANVAHHAKGVQMAAFANFAENNSGVQIAAFNVAKHNHGMQFGIVNIADSTHNRGVPVGLLSFVRQNGIHKLEVSASETFQVALNYKTGVRQFYNIIALGTQFDGNKLRWGLGYGVGTQFSTNPKTFWNVDLVAYHLSESEVWTRELNMLNQLRVQLNYRLANKVNLFAGPVVNVLFSDFRNADASIGSKVAPWIFFDGYWGNTRVKSWLGGTVGISF